jgi:hypothetical protein
MAREKRIAQKLRELPNKSAKTASYWAKPTGSHFGVGLTQDAWMRTRKPSSEPAHTKNYDLINRNHAVY